MAEASRRTSETPRNVFWKPCRGDSGVKGVMNGRGRASIEEGACVLDGRQVRWSHVNLLALLGGVAGGTLAFFGVPSGVQAIVIPSLAASGWLLLQFLSPAQRLYIDEFAAQARGGRTIEIEGHRPDAAGVVRVKLVFEKPHDAEAFLSDAKAGTV
jgi:hypothetical protein